MTLPRSILEAAEKAAEDRSIEQNYEPNYRDGLFVGFRDGAEWLFTHLCEMAEGEFDLSNMTINFANMPRAVNLNQDVVRLGDVKVILATCAVNKEAFEYQRDHCEGALKELAQAREEIAALKAEIDKEWKLRSEANR